MSIKYELQSIISGNGEVRHGKTIQTIINYLRGKKTSISGFEEAKFNKEQETKILIDFINSNSLWFKNLGESKYIGEGAEQRIYEFIDPIFVL